MHGATEVVHHMFAVRHTSTPPAVHTDTDRTIQTGGYCYRGKVLNKDQVVIRWLLLTENDLIKHASGRYISIYIYVYPLQCKFGSLRQREVRLPEHVGDA